MKLRMRSATRQLSLFAALAILLSAVPSLPAQVHYRDDGAPWNHTTERGPDAEVPGWYYNLGITGLRVELRKERPTDLLVRYVFADSPAAKKIEVGDWIVGVGKKKFTTPHRNGYGMDVFGPHGPILDFAVALEASQRKKGVLSLAIERDKKTRAVDLEVGKEYGAFAPKYPASCEKSEKIRRELLDYLLEHQREDGSWGSPPHDTFAPLALLTSDEKKDREALVKNVRFHARTTKAEDSSWLINWRYMAAGIVLSEYYLATGERWVIPELEEIYAFICSSQYLDLSQVDEKSKKDRPEDMPKNPLDSHGGWGHNPGFEGYGPISMITGQGALVLSLMERCGLTIDHSRLEAALAFLDRGTGPNGYVWYEDSVAGRRDWADMGRTGASGIAHALSPIERKKTAARAKEHAKIIGEHPESFPDTHGSPVMGMGYAALAAHTDRASWRKLLDANRWWFALAQCPDGSFYYQPNRDNAGYGEDSRISATAVTALMLSIPRGNLAVTGRKKDAPPEAKKKAAPPKEGTELRAE